MSDGVVHQPTERVWQLAHQPLEVRADGVPLIEQFGDAAVGPFANLTVDPGLVVALRRVVACDEGSGHPDEMGTQVVDRPVGAGWHDNGG